MPKSIKNLDQELFISQVGDTTIITRNCLSELEKIDQVRVLIEPDLIGKIKAFLEKTPSIEASKILGISEKKVHRFRKGLKVADWYTGKSATTKWRNEKKGKK